MLKYNETEALCVRLETHKLGERRVGLDMERHAMGGPCKVQNKYTGIGDDVEYSKQITKE